MSLQVGITGDRRGNNSGCLTKVLANRHASFYMVDQDIASPVVAALPPM
jgi:hypothetical protein